MSRKWNGSDLTTDLRSELWNGVSAARVTGWINDGLQDMADRHDWICLRRTGQKTLTASTEEQTLDLAVPTAPVATAVSGGNLTASTDYSVRVTFYESSSGRESVQGAESNTVTTTTTKKGISLTSVPVSLDPDVDKRRIYVKKGTGEYLYVGDIDNNTATSATLSTLTADFSGDGTGFTETGTGIDWSGSSAQIEEYAGASGELFYASYSVLTTAERSEGDTTDSLGSVTIDSGKADLTGYVATERLQYDVSAGDILPLDTGTIEFFLTPNFTGAPAGKQNFVVFGHTSGNVNIIDLRYDTSQQWLIRIYDSSAAVMVSQVISASGQFTSGTEYHIALSWDLATADECKLFVDGVQVGSTFTNTGGSRTTAGVTRLHVGNNIAGGENPNFYIRDFLVTNTYDRAAPFTPPTTGLIYSTSAAKVTYNTAAEAVGMQDLTETVSKPSNTAITYTMTIGGVEYYVTGGAWALSDGTVSQSSSVADLNAVSGTFPGDSEPETTKLNAFLVSSDGRATPTITTLIFDYFAEGFIDEDTSSVVEPPDYDQISRIDGNLWDAANSYPLQYINHRHLKQSNAGGSTGTPTAWSQINDSKVALSPAPSSASTVGFYYFKTPCRIYATDDSQPDFPPGFRRAIEAFVLMRGYKYLDRDGAESKENDYLQAIEEAKRSMNNRARRISKVREVNGDTFGFEVH